MSDDFDVGFRPPIYHDFSSEILGNRYALKRRIGCGATASIYEATDQRTEATVAVKVLHPEYNTNAELTRRFAQEARLAAQIRHPNLVPAHDFGWLGGKRFIVLELVRGPTLSTLLGTGPLPWQRSVPLVCDLLAALVALHEHGVAHRDVSPNNCLIDTSHGAERARLADLGYARVLEDRGLALAVPPASVTRIIHGTEHYIEPERLHGGPGDYRADVFSLGAVWYTMLTGATLLDPRDANGKDLAPVGHLPLPAPLAAVLRGSLVPRARRHHSAASMLAAVRAAMQELERSQVRRRRAWIIAPVLGLVALPWALATQMPTPACPAPTVVRDELRAPACAPLVVPDSTPSSVGPRAPSLPSPPPTPEVVPIDPPTSSPRVTSHRPAFNLRRALSACKPSTHAHLEVAFGPGQPVTINDGPALGELGRCLKDVLAKHPPRRAAKLTL